MRRKTTQKSARFPVEQCPSPYPSHYSPTFAFSAIPYPHSQQITLRLTCPKAAIRAYHVPCLSHDWVRACLFAGDHIWRRVPTLDQNNRSHHLFG